MHFIYILARILPYWAIPVAILSAEVAIFYRRKKKGIQYLFWSIMVSASIGSFFWLVYRGDLNSDQWMRSLLN